MRILFFALVLANLGFAAWAAWYAGSPPTRPVGPDDDALPIRLISEVEDAPEPSADADGQAAPAADARPSLDLTPRIAPPALGRALGDADDTPAAADGGSAGEAAAADDPVDAGSAGDAPRAPADGETAAATPGPDGAGPPARCISVGPFMDESEVAAAMSRLRDAGHRASERFVESEVFAGYWVHLDAIPTREAANDALDRLHGNGVSEAYLIAGEEGGDVVSLGVFSDRARAGRLRDRVREIGYEPLVVERTRQARVRWVDVMLGAGRELELESLQAPGRIMRLEQRSCPAAG